MYRCFLRSHVCLSLAVSKTNFSALRASVWSKNKGGAGPPRATPLGPPLVIYIQLYIASFISASDFFHEQARGDRDKYVKIYLENILPSKILHTVVNHTYVVLTGHQRKTANYCCKRKAKKVYLFSTTRLFTQLSVENIGLIKLVL